MIVSTYQLPKRTWSMLLKSAKDKRLTGDRYKMSVIDPEYGDGKGNSHGRYNTPRTPLEFNIEEIKNFKYDMDHCIKCKGCYWVEHTYNPGVKFNVRWSVQPLERLRCLRRFR